MSALELMKTFSYALENQIHFVCRGLDGKDMKWRSDSGAPSIGWIIGHVLVNHDLTVNHKICENSLLFEDIWEDFGMGGTGDFPVKFSYDDLMTRFKQLNSEIVNTLKSKENDWLTEIPDVSEFPPNWQGKNRMKVFVLHCNHSFTHIGQILEIKRQLGKGAWGF